MKMTFKTVLALLLLAVTSMLQAADDANESGEDEGFFGLGWLDTTQEIATERANSLASQLDRFFGEPRSDLEAAYSSLRLTLENEWVESERVEPSLRLRGKLHLPRIEERLSLIFSDEEGDSFPLFNGAGEDAGTRTSLEFNLLDKVAERLDLRVGLTSSLKGKTRVRYRYQTEEENDRVHRFIQQVYFRDSEGFGSLSRYELDLMLADTTLLRWSNDIRFEEELSGSRWSSRLSYSLLQSDQTALIYYTGLHGRTGPGYISKYDVGVRLRRNMARPWLFLEIEPGHAWEKTTLHEGRQGSFFLFVRLEMAIGRQ